MSHPKNYFPRLKFVDEPEGVTLEEISQFAVAKTINFPKDLISWLSSHNGGMLARDNYFIPRDHLSGIPCGVAVEYLMSIEEIEGFFADDLITLPGSTLPFAQDGDGNYILMDIGGKIFFWDWQGRINESLSAAIDKHTIQLANSLTDFLYMLGVGPLTN